MLNEFDGFVDSKSQILISVSIIPNFETKYSYSWQHPFDPVNNGQVDVTVEGSFDKTDLEKHAISITHTDTAIGKAVADLVAAELQKDKDRKLQISTKTF